MVIVCINTMYMECGIFFDDSVDVSDKFILYIFFQIFSTIQRSPNEVILSLVDRVIQASDSHATKRITSECDTYMVPFIPARSGRKAGGVS